MSSAIDPTRPVDNIPASKADLRANLATAKRELEHGGFAEGLSPANYGPPASSRTIDHLQSIDDALGAGDGGVTAFADLLDTPPDYTGQASRYPRVKADESGLEFVEQAAGGDASTTSYAAPGTGAVTRSVRDKLRDVISVKDFGATGDGVADDHAAIQAALDYLASPLPGNAVGGTLYFPRGRYTISDMLINNGDVGMVGSAQGSMIAALPGFPATTMQSGKTFPTPMLWVRSGNGQHTRVIEQLHFDGEDIAPIALLMTLGACWQVNGLRVQDTILDGVVLDGLQNSTMTNWRIARTSRYAIRIINGTRWNHFYSCFVRDPGEIGVFIEGNDTSYPGHGSFTNVTDIGMWGGLIEGTKTGFTKQHALKISNGLRHKFYGVQFYQPCAISYVEINSSRCTLDHCGWAGIDTVPALVVTSDYCDVIGPHFNGFASSGNLMESSKTNGLYLARPRFTGTTAAGKLVAATPLFDARFIRYEDQRASGATGQRPIMTQIDAVVEYWDTTLKKPIWWDPTSGAWRDAAGTVV